RDVERLAVEERGIPIGVADGRSLFDEARLRLVLRAAAEEVRRSVADSRREAVVVGDAEAALAVADQQAEGSCAPELVMVEAEEVPVVVRRRIRVVQVAARGQC